VVVAAPRARIAGWSLKTPVSEMKRERVKFTFVGAQADGCDFELSVRGAEPLTLNVDEHYLGTTEATRTVEAALPDWTAAFTQLTTRASVTL
jgi:hypothetical protein